MTSIITPSAEEVEEAVADTATLAAWMCGRISRPENDPPFPVHARNLDRLLTTIQTQASEIEGLKAANANLVATQAEEIARIGVARDIEREALQSALDEALEVIEPFKRQANGMFTVDHDALVRASSLYDRLKGRTGGAKPNVEACITDLKAGLCCPRVHGCEQNDGELCLVRQAFARAGRIQDEPQISCGITCFIAEDKMRAA